MNREIKFRAWHNGNDIFYPQMLDLHAITFKGDRVGITYSGYIREEYNHPNVAKEKQRRVMTNVELTDEIVLMQYSGIFDKNKNNICDGDVVKFKYDNESYTSQVFYEDATFKVDIPEYLIFSLCYPEVEDIEVIGDVYQDKELLNE